MRARGVIFLALLMALLAGCSTQPATLPSASHLTLRIPEIKLAPATLGESISLAQRLTLVSTGDAGINARPQSQRTLETLLEIDQDSVRLAGFAMNQRVLSMVWDGKVLTASRHFMLPAEVNLDKVLRDITLNYWPAEAIRATLPPDWSLLDAGNERILSYQGQPQVLIHYSATPRWTGRADLNNRLENYRLTIESTVQSVPTP